MKSEEMAMALVDEFINKYDISVSEDVDFHDKTDIIRDFVDNHDDLERHTEVEIRLTVEITTGMPVSDMLFEDWYNGEARNLTMRVADDGFDRAADVESVEIEEIWDF